MDFLLGLTIGTIAGIVVHELAHAVAAWLAGFGVRRISIGTGQSLLQVNIRGTEIVLKRSLLSGYVLPRSVPSRPNVALLAFIIAGFLGNALLMIFAYAMLRHAYGWVGLFWLGFAWAQAWLIVNNLWPRDTKREGKLAMTDGKLLWLSLHGINAGDYLLQKHFALTLSRYSPSGEPVNARSRVLERIGQILLKGTLTDDERIRELYQLLQIEISTGELTVPERLYLTDRIVTYWLLHSPQTHVHEMAELTSEALALSPGAKDIERTHCAVLIEMGRFEEARQLLERDDLRSENNLDQLMFSYCSARVAEGMGERENARVLVFKLINQDLMNAPPDTAYLEQLRSFAADLQNRLSVAARGLSKCY